MIENAHENSARASASRQRRADLVCALIIIGISLAVALPRYRLGIEWRDEGFLAYGTVRVMEGQVPNRDFVTLQPPLSFYVAAAVFKLFGTSLASLRILGLSIHVMVPLLIYGITRKMMSAGFSMMAALPATIVGIPFFGFVPFAAWQGITITLAAIFFYFSALTTKRPWLAALAGILTTLGFCTRHEQAFYLAISIVVLTVGLWFAKDDSFSASALRRVSVSWLVVGVVLALGFVFLWWRQGALPEMFNQLVVFPATNYARTSSLPFPRLDPGVTLAENSATLFYFVPPLVVLIGAASLVRHIARRDFSKSEAFLTFLTTWSALFYVQVVARSDFNHLVITLPPFFILCAYSTSILSAYFRKRSAKICAVSSVAATGICFLVILQPIALPDLSLCNQFLELERARVRMDNAPLVTDLVRDIQRYVPPDRSILSLPYFPMLYFLSERRNPTRWNYLWPGDQTAQDYAKLISESQNDPPAAVFINGEDYLASFAPAILDYVHREYRRETYVGNVSIYLPQPVTP